MKNKETSNLLEMDLKTRQKLAQGVIMNAKEVISVGLHGKETKTEARKDGFMRLTGSIGQ